MIVTLSFCCLICLLFELFATKNHEFVISKPITTLIFLYKQRYKPTQSDKVIRCLCVCHICPFLKGCGDIRLSLKQLCQACAVYGMHMGGVIERRFWVSLFITRSKCERHTCISLREKSKLKELGVQLHACGEVWPLVWSKSSFLLLLDYIGHGQWSIDKYSFTTPCAVHFSIRHFGASKLLPGIHVAPGTLAVVSCPPKKYCTAMC